MAPKPRTETDEVAAVALIASSSTAVASPVISYSEGVKKIMPQAATESGQITNSKTAKETMTTLLSSPPPLEDRISVCIMYRTVVFALTVLYAFEWLFSEESEDLETSKFASPSRFWGAAFAMSLAVEASSPALNYVAQYAYPVILAGQCMASGQHMSLLQVAFFFPIVVFLIGVPMSICLHRYFSHQAFETSRPMQYILGLVSCLAYQGGPLWWAAKHVRHHRHCDLPLDPHSAYQSGTWYAFIGWTCNPANLANRDVTYLNPSFASCWELRILDRMYIAPGALLCACVESMWDRPTVAYMVLLPMLLCRLITLVFNVEFHPPADTRRCKGVDQDRRLAEWVGESQHADHHIHPRRAHRPDMDLPWLLTLSWMEPLGLVWNCHK